MKTKKFMMLIAVFMVIGLYALAQVAVNADGLLPAASAMLDVSSTAKGMLIPRMNTAQRNGISAPAAGLLVYDTGTKSFWYYDNSMWNQIANGGVPASSYIRDADGNTKVETEKNPNENMIRFTINGTERMRLESKWLTLVNPLYSVCIGDSAGAKNTSGDDNTFVGYYAGKENTTGDWNTFIGKTAGRDNTTGDYNTFTGRAAGMANTVGSNNAFYGLKSGLSNDIGSYNSFFGHYSGVENTSGIKNTFIGSQAGYSNTTGDNNSFLGRSAGYSNNTGTDNAFIGIGAGYLNTSGSHNIAIGSDALYHNTTASSLVAVGDSAMYNTNYGGTLGSGLYNTGIGAKALFTNFSGAGNTAVGFHSLVHAGNTYNNMTAVGYDVGTSSHAGGHSGYNTKSNCTMIGSELEANGINTILIGHNIKPGWANGTPAVNPGFDTIWHGTDNCIYIGNNITAISNGSNVIQLGSSVQTELRCPAAASSLSTLSTHHDLYVTDGGVIGILPAPDMGNADVVAMDNVDWLYKLRPVNFTYKSDGNKTKQYGLVAEEVALVAPEFVGYNKDKQPESVSYPSLVSPLIKAVQEQQAIISSMQQMIELLQKEVETLKNR